MNFAQVEPVLRRTEANKCKQSNIGSWLGWTFDIQQTQQDKRANYFSKLLTMGATRLNIMFLQDIIIHCTRLLQLIL